MYYKEIESVLGAKAKYDEAQKSAASARLKTVADKKKAKRKAKQEAAA